MSSESRRAQQKRILSEAATVAVLGAHPDPERAAHYVPAYLHEHGYEVLPVNVTKQGQQLWDRPVAARLDALRVPVDVVDVFRASEHLPGHVDEILAMDPRPSVVWFQKGIRHDEVARELEADGIEVVQDACMMEMHQRLGLGSDDGGA